MPNISTFDTHTLIALVRDGMREGSSYRAAAIEKLQGLLAQPDGNQAQVGEICASPANTYEYVEWRNEKMPAAGTKLFTHPAPFTPVTKADITDEMTKAMQTALFADGIDDKDIMVFAVNAYMGAKK